MTSHDADHIFDVLASLLQERFDISATHASLGTPLQELGVDSMMVMDVMLDVEDRLGLKLEDLALPRKATLGDVLTMIERNIGIRA